MNHSLLTRAYFIFAFAIFPLVGCSYTRITGLKTGVIVSVSLLWLALVAVAGRRELAWPRLGLTGWALGFWLGWSLLSAAASPLGGEAWLGQGRAGGWLGQAFCLALFLAAAGAGGAEMKLLRRALSLSVLLTAAIALWQLAGGNPLGLYPAGLDYYDGEVLYNGSYLGLIGNTGQLGAFFCLALPILAWSWPTRAERAEARPGWGWLLLQGLALAAGLAVVIGAQLEASWLGLAGGGLLTLAMLPRRAGRRWLCLGLLAALVGAALYWLWQGGGDPNSSWGQLGRLLHGEWRADYGSMRIGIWQGAWQLWQQRPWLGWGPDCFRGAWQTLYGAAAAPVDAAHNEYLGYAATCGLPALLAYVLALSVTLLRLCRRRAWPQFCALLCYALQALFSFPTFLVAPLFWLLWGRWSRLRRE